MTSRQSPTTQPPTTPTTQPPTTPTTQPPTADVSAEGFSPMPTMLGWFYLVGGTVLFFWAYGIVSFLLDLKNYVIPGVRGIIAQRREDAETVERERERTEMEKQLY